MPAIQPAEWLSLLERRLDARRPAIELADRYYRGDHKLAFATTKFREAFGNLFGAFADNWTQLVVDASVERLAVEGFRFGRDSSADDEAWSLWQANGLDAESELAHTESVKLGRSYVLVDPTNTDVPRITVEHPAQTVVAHAAGDRRRRVAALKRWVDDDGFLYANVYLPDLLAKYRSSEPASSSGRVAWREYDRGRNPLGVVPVIELPNNPSMLGGGQSDVLPVIPLQDAANKLVSDLLVASEYAAFPQRVLTGVEVPTDDVGNPVAGADLRAALSRVWTFEDPDVKWGEFSVADLGNYVRAVEMLVQHVAAQTRTPPHYLLGQSGAFPSGESLKSTETGLVAKVRRKQRFLGEGWEESVRLGFLAMGDARRAQATDAETLWRDPESRTTGEQVDAAVKELSLGVPQEAIWARRLGASPQEVARWKALQVEETARAGLFGFDLAATSNGAAADGTAIPPIPPAG